MIDLDPREEYQQGRSEPTEDLKEVMIGSQPHQSTKIGTSLAPSEEKDLIQLLKRNLDLFAFRHARNRSQRGMPSPRREPNGKTCRSEKAKVGLGEKKSSG